MGGTYLVSTNSYIFARFSTDLLMLALFLGKMAIFWKRLQVLRQW